MKYRFWKRLTDDRGVTLTETMVSLILLSVLMIILFRLGTALIPGMKDDWEAFFGHNRELVLVQAFNYHLSDVTPPWWLKEYSPEADKDRWEFPWYMGDESLSLVIEREEGMILFSQGEDVMMELPAPENLDLEWIELPRRGYFLSLSLDDRKLYFPLGSSLVPSEDR